MARFHKFVGQGLVGEIYVDLDSIEAVRPISTGTRILFGQNAVDVGHTVQGVMELIFPLNTLVPQPAPAPVNGDEGEELAALREKVRALEATPDGFKDHRRRTEALKKARLYELYLIEKTAAGDFGPSSWLARYLSHRIGEIERGGF
ncbi:MAG: hypothetical protein ABFD96_06120 [Armatimonadia bacterium]